MQTETIVTETSPLMTLSPRLTTLGLTALAMLAFAANSLLCRLAIDEPHIDAASFTTLRLVSGALALWLLMRRRKPSQRGGPDGSRPRCCSCTQRPFPSPTCR